LRVLTMSTEVAPSSTGEAKSASFHMYDLTTVFMKYLDPQMSVMMIDFLVAKNLYPEVELMYAKMKMLMKTFLVEKAEQTLAKFKELKGERAQIDQLEEEFATMKKNYEEEKTTIEQLWETQKTVFENEELMGVVNGTRKINEGSAEEGSTEEEASTVNAKTLSKTFGVNVAALTTLFRYAHFLYRSGAFDAALPLLQQFLLISKYFSDEIVALKGKVLWCKLACNIMLNHADDGFADVDAIRGYIDSLVVRMRDEPRSVSHLQLLYMRVWLLHWCLFVYMHSPEHLQDGKDKLADLYQNTQYMNAIQTEAPHLMRYLVVAWVTNKRKQRSMEAITRNVLQILCMYGDSFTSFIERMNLADFDGALAALNECREKLFPNDIIVESFQDEFVQSARLLLFQKFVVVHRRIDVPALANKLCLSEKEVEQWVVDLIRNNSHFDARIDSAANQMIFGTQQQSVYQNVIEVAKKITSRAEDLSRYLEEYEEAGSIPSAAMGRYRRG